MKIHLIAIGGAVMHNVALALQKAGHEVTGSDDEIFEPSRSRLQAKGLMPETIGWHPERLHRDIDLVILGMHAKLQNPELLEAKKLGIRVLSFPEFVYEQSKDKTRVAICGSHGKTTITSMVMHALKLEDKAFDYLVGAQLQGFDTMVQFSDADTVVIEGDEYHASALLPKPKFLYYQAQIVLISGIAWDHYNVFPTLESYHQTFRQLFEQGTSTSTFYINEEDEALLKLAAPFKTSLSIQTYAPFAYQIKNGYLEVYHDNQSYKMKVFGRHNISNLAGAARVCEQLGIPVSRFLHHLQSFTGAAKRLENLPSHSGKLIFRDFAHAPSKVKATVNAVLEKFETEQILAVLELHTYSSLNKGFLPQYQNSMNGVHHAWIYYNPRTLEFKQMEPISEPEMQAFFNRNDIRLFTDIGQLASAIKESDTQVRLFMSSGNFDNLNFDQLI